MRIKAAALLFCLVWLMACREEAAVPTPSSISVSPIPSSYFLLREQPAALIEIDRFNKRNQFIFQLESPLFENEHPEGLTFVPNADVLEFGLFGLPPSDQGGYFLIAAQTHNRLHIFDVPTGTQGKVVDVKTLSVPGLDHDAKGLHYATGSIWIAAENGQKLIQIGTAYVDGEVQVRATYTLEALPTPIKDVEGITFKGSDTIFIAEDNTRIVSRYDNFPQCLNTQSCQRTWVRSFGDSEPSGAVWDDYSQRLLIADDEGHLFSVDENGENFESIILAAEDFEGISVMPPILAEEN